MFVPHVVMPHRRDCRKPTPRERLGGVAAAVVAALVSAAVGGAFSHGSRAGSTALAVVAVGLAFAGGVCLARVVGRRRKD